MGGSAPKSGTCRICQCTELQPCLAQLAPGEPLIACTWLDFDHTLCTNFRCVAAVPLAELLEMPIVRDALVVER